MEITSETYRAIGGHMVTRHIVSFGERSADHSLNTRQLWQLVMLGIVELGKYLREPADREYPELDETVADLAVAKIVNDLRSRWGVGWEDIDPNGQSEAVETWISLIVDTMKRARQ